MTRRMWQASNNGPHRHRCPRSPDRRSFIAIAMCAKQIVIVCPRFSCRSWLAFEVRTLLRRARRTHNFIANMSATESSTTHFFTVDVEEYFQVKALEAAVSPDEWLSRPSRVSRSIDV